MTNYVPTTWVDDFPPGTGTPLDAAHFNKLEGGAAAALPRQSVFTAGSIPYQNRLFVGDVQPAFRFGGDGKLEWGAGGSSLLDTSLYRSAAGTLKTEGTLLVAGTLDFNAP